MDQNNPQIIPAAIQYDRNMVMAVRDMCVCEREVPCCVRSYRRIGWEPTNTTDRYAVVRIGLFVAHKMIAEDDILPGSDPFGSVFEILAVKLTC